MFTGLKPFLQTKVLMPSYINICATKNDNWEVKEDGELKMIIVTKFVYTYNVHVHKFVLNMLFVSFRTELEKICLQMAVSAMYMFCL